MNKRNWRLILSPASSGAWNMALDEALLKSIAGGNSLPTLRLYSWEPATLSLGFAQPAADVDVDHLEIEKWGLVRRPTGGRAILHVDELTYSVCASANDTVLAGDLLESYCNISRALLNGLTHLQVAAVGDKTYSDTSHTDHSNPICFETPSDYEITINGKKLIGSAQARKYGGILQHGTLPIHGDITRITRALKFGSAEERTNAATKLKARATTLESELGTRMRWQDVANAIIKGFAESFNISFIEIQPDAREIADAQSIMAEKYLSDGWNFRI